MDKIREAMELALKERWEGPTKKDAGEADTGALAASGGRVAARIAALKTGGRDAASSQAGEEAGDETVERGIAPAAQIKRMPLRDDSAAPPTKLRRRRPPAGPASTARVQGTYRRVELDQNVLRSNLLVAALDGHPAREAYCLLQAALLERLGDGDRRWVGVTRPRSGRGKALTASNVAISLAIDAGLDVLLIDLDLRNPSLARLFGVTAQKGLEDCLFSKAPLEEATLATSLDGLTLLPVRKASRSAAQVLGSPNLKALFGEIRRRHPDHLVVVNLPPLTGTADGAAVKALVDGVLLVVDEGETREADYQRALDGVGKGKLLGTVLNRAEPAE
jgi:protein-tyrosine kinase